MSVTGEGGGVDSPAVLRLQGQRLDPLDSTVCPSSQPVPDLSMTNSFRVVVALPGLACFADEEDCDDQRRNRVRPPQAEDSVEGQT